MILRRLSIALLFLMSAGLISASAQKAKTSAGKSPNFAKLKEQFLDDCFRLYPDFALDAGNHKYDSLLPAFDARQMAQVRNVSIRYLKQLKTIDQSKLSPVEKIELAMMRGEMISNLFSIDTLKSYQWNPAVYNAPGRFAQLLNNTGTALPVRMQNITKALRYVPAYYQAARKNIQNPTREHTQLAVFRLIGTMDVFDKEIVDSGNKAKLGFRDMELLKARCKAASEAAQEYANFLQGLKPAKWRSYALGDKLYRRKFYHDLGLPIGPDEAFRLAQARKAEMHRRMYTLATGGLWAKYFDKEAMPADTLTAIRQLSDKISLSHTTRDSFQTVIARQIPELEAFVTKTGIAAQDPTKPLQVRKEPEYMKGVAGASISSAGYYEPNSYSYYNVGSLAGYSEEDAESFLREYNRYTLQILNIHEAVPGHYIQLIYANKTPSAIMAIFGNTAMIEGWAVYSEQAMLEAGYGKGVPEIEFMYAKWHLRSVCNTILDISVHTRGLDSTQAMHLLTQEAFQQTEEARGKWRRVRLTQVQLCAYFTGYSQIIACRERLQARLGDKFNVRQFHDRLLSYGSPPLKYLIPRVEADFK